jgi:pimeloyl-ACP methyl ester carboxylesterase
MTHALLPLRGFLGAGDDDLARSRGMPTVIVGQQNGVDIEIYVHGDADRILRFDTTAKRLPGLIEDLTFVTAEGGPDNLAWTHPDEVNQALLSFVKR